MIRLNMYGWNDRLNQLKQESAYNTLSHGRIAIVHRTCYEVVSESGLYQCELTGNMMYGKSDFELPCTGDWVLFQPFDDSKGIIVGMLPRERTLYRKRNGTVAGNRQLLRMLTRRLSCRVSMIISICAGWNVSWFRYWKKTSILY